MRNPMRTKTEEWKKILRKKVVALGEEVRIMLGMNRSFTVCFISAGQFGLGLALVQRIVKSLGGSCAAQVEGDGIFIIKLTLPRKQ